jgi:FixJ family two-component response regulator
MALPALIAVVDDDASVLDSLPELLEDMGFRARGFSSAVEFLGSGAMQDTDCLVLDIAMPGMTGPDLRDELQTRGCAIPIIFMTAQNDEAIRSALLEQGAKACLFKPFKEDALRAALDLAVDSS